ncbi:MAG: glycosyltransferase family 2 protein, partial [Pseudomonadota bacterium]
MYRAWQKRGQLTPIHNCTHRIRRGDIIGFSTVRNEITRLPFFLDHHRALGVAHFIVVDNASDDGTADYLAQQPDVSLWSTPHSYKAARFGVDWLMLLQRRYAHGHWALTLDADEILVYPNCDTHPLPMLTRWLQRHGHRSFGAIMLDMYPNGPLGAPPYVPGTPIWNTLTHFDGQGYTHTWQEKYRNASIRGGVRKRVFFQNTPDHAPHLHKIPLIHWRRPYAYVSSTHVALPPHLNAAFQTGQGRPTGALL